MERKTVALWALYDFANSTAIAVFLLYFSQWLVVDQHVSDIWYNLIFVGSSALLILTAPLASIAADRRGIKMPYLRILTICQFLFLILTSVTASYFPPSVLVFVLAGLCFMISNFLHQFALVFYNALLPSIAVVKSRGFTSGIGLSAKFLGTIFGLAITLPLSHASFTLLGHPGRSQTFLPASIVALLLTVPPFFIKERPPQTEQAADMVNEPSGYVEAVSSLWRTPGIARFLISYFFFNDAIVTIEHNMPIYMQQVMGLSDRAKTLISGSVLAMSAGGALFGGWLSDKIGLKKTLIGVLSAWVLFLPCLSYVKDLFYFVALALVMGFLFGVTITVSRATMAYLAPIRSASHAFSYYTIAERFSTFIGPVAWGGIATAFHNLGPVRYRLALFAMTAFIAIGLFIVRRVPSDPITA
jgi:UMF1 family MFS transporter